ncbi:hypothetical protein CISG_03247 [Coccidioides immitis RMSCC 3703]|uniref:Uncharacterized protein n=1 Tax=Coccidioides immitis RMSCC 3703 TaxID=454286 RepID=A0A0J8QNI6_COCIT|nr:hypothetical protein CISG_03247 [Coccidioides immitis RMSCC 3703]
MWSGWGKKQCEPNDGVKTPFWMTGPKGLNSTDKSPRTIAPWSIDGLFQCTGLTPDSMSYIALCLHTIAKSGTKFMSSLMLLEFLALYLFLVPPQVRNQGQELLQ